MGRDAVRLAGVWSVFALCVLVLLAALLWITSAALRLDRSEIEANQRAIFEENLRLSLWRLDSVVSPIVSRESGFPYFAYTSFYPAERAYTRMFNEIRRGEVLVPSPLMARQSSYVVIHFQFDPKGGLQSPQVPRGDMRDIAELGYRTGAAIESSAASLKALAGRVDFESLYETELADLTEAGLLLDTLAAPPRISVVREDRNARGNLAAQQALGENEFQARDWAANRLGQGVNNFTYFDNPPQSARSEDRVVTASLMRGRWVNGQLLLLRAVRVGKDRYLQGCWLDWERLGAFLAGSIRDLFPRATLKAAVGRDDSGAARLIASLPVVLVPHAPAQIEDRGMSAITLSVITVWICFFVAAGAVGFLLAGAIGLSERRGAFVSAVTHELRTPLTTFRMYTEMLCMGMVPSAEKRKRYLETLRVEADRLSHLVENVLAFARLERGRGGGRRVEVSLDELFSGFWPRFADRAERAGMELLPRNEAGLDGVVILGDPTALEQVLFNLLDNSCKYACRARDRRISITVEADLKWVRFLVRDRGPGIREREARRLFQPFRKSAREAASTAPGVGLGLALSRRLARAMKGQLRVDLGVDRGALFILELPRYLIAAEPIAPVVEASAPA